MVRVTVGILRDGERILICQRRAGARFGLKWEFPGGRIEPGETPEACLGRELFEELGVRAEIGERLQATEYRYPDGFAVRLEFFRVRGYAGQPTNLAFQRMAWVLPHELGGYDFLEADRELVGRLLRGEVAP